MPRQSASTEPVILDLPDLTVATVTSVGDPNVVGTWVFPALYGAVYALKFALKKHGIVMAMEPLRARWPDAHLRPKDEWTALWAIPVPEGTTALVQKNPDVPVTVAAWSYGTVAQILHKGPFSEEGPTVARLHAFIEASGYEIAGPHEEVYLTRPDAKEQKTLIRYQVRIRA